MDDRKTKPSGGTYEPPTITDHGDLTELTAFVGSGGYTDADFPAGTPTGALSFSSTP